MRTQGRRRAAGPRAVVVALVAGLALTACAGGDGPEDGSPPPTPTETAGPTEQPSPTLSPSPGGTDDDGDGDAPPFPANTEADTGEATGGAVGTLTDIRLGGHDGFDRVVFEFAGSGTPSWNVRYVDEAIQDASGMPMEVDGDAILE